MPASSRFARGIGRSTWMVVGALVLVAVGAGSAMGISALVGRSPVSGSRATTSTTPWTPATGSGVTSPTATAPTSESPAGVVTPASTSGTRFPAPSTAVGPAGELVTPAVVSDVLATTWTGYAQAMNADDRTALAAYTSPTGLSDAEAVLDCGCIAGPTTYATAVTSVPQQTGYPLAFLEGLSGTAYDQRRLTRWVVFTKADFRSPWIISYLAAYVDGNGLDGFTPFSSLAPFAGTYPLSEGPAAFADFFQQLETTGNDGSGAPPDFAQSPILDSDVTGSENWVTRAKTAAVTVRYRHSIDGVSPVFPQVVDGAAVGEMSCFAMHVTEVITSPGSTPVVQPPDESLLGNLVPVGVLWAGDHRARK